MLLMFKVKNYTSFKNEAILGLRATSYVQHPSHVIHVNDKLGLLKATALYGANASGKSNLISAMFFFEQYIFSQFITKKENVDFEAGEVGLKMKLEPFSLSDNVNHASEFDIIFLQPCNKVKPDDRAHRVAQPHGFKRSPLCGERAHRVYFDRKSLSPARRAHGQNVCKYVRHKRIHAASARR